MQEVHIFSPWHSKPRLQYSCHLIFGCVLAVPYRLRHYEQWADLPEGAPCLLYGQAPPAGHRSGPWIYGTGLLAAAQPSPIEVATGTVLDTQALFVNPPVGDALGFDVLSAVFYMVSRYEEYLPFSPDAFGRFPEKASIGHKMGFTGQAIVHHWCALLRHCLQRSFPHWQPPVRSASALFTYDIDVAYAYKGRPWHTHLLSLGKDILHANFHSLLQKGAYCFGRQRDPWDCYDNIEQTPVPQLFFFLMTAKRTQYDRNLPPEQKELQALVKRLQRKAPVGIHPSYYATEMPERVLTEKARLTELAGTPIIHSRQHYLRFRLPQYARTLLSAGIQHDYSMQYPEIPGFRAGICVPYPWYDLLNECTTALTIHPGCIMDTTFRDDLHLPPEDALPLYLQLSAEVERWGGVFISIWHNDLVGKPWYKHYLHSFAGVHSQMANYWTQRVPPAPTEH